MMISVCLSQVKSFFLVIISASLPLSLHLPLPIPLPSQDLASSITQNGLPHTSQQSMPHSSMSSGPALPPTGPSHPPAMNGGQQQALPPRPQNPAHGGQRLQVNVAGVGGAGGVARHQAVTTAASGSGQSSAQQQGDFEVSTLSWYRAWLQRI